MSRNVGKRVGRLGTQRQVAGSPTKGGLSAAFSRPQLYSFPYKVICCKMQVWAAWGSWGWIKDWRSSVKFKSFWVFFFCSWNGPWGEFSAPSTLYRWENQGPEKVCVTLNRELQPLVSLWHSFLCVGLLLLCSKQIKRNRELCSTIAELRSIQSGVQMLVIDVMSCRKWLLSILPFHIHLD